MNKRRQEMLLDSTTTKARELNDYQMFMQMIALKIHSKYAHIFGPEFLGCHMNQFSTILYF